MKCKRVSLTKGNGEGLAPPAVELSPVGRCVKEQILALPERYPQVRVDHYVIMPNHIHLLLSWHMDSGGASPSPTLFDVVRVLKSLSVRLSRDSLGKLPLWQRSFYEHVIRSEHDYRESWEYVEANPAKWAEDRYYDVPRSCGLSGARAGNSKKP